MQRCPALANRKFSRCAPVVQSQIGESEDCLIDPVVIIIHTGFLRFRNKCYLRLGPEYLAQVGVQLGNGCFSVNFLEQSLQY